MLIAVAQLNPTVGDLQGNTDAACRAVEHARQAGADLVVLPELALLGYPPRDLFYSPGFMDAADQALETLLAASHGMGIVLGHVLRSGRGPANMADPSSRDFGGGELLQVAVLLAEDGAILGRQHKHRLPCYDVFEECRYFTPGRSTQVAHWRGLRVGLSVCEDLWYEDGVLSEQAGAGVDLMVNVSASPYFRGKPTLRRQLAGRWAKLAGTTLVYANMVGGQDELVFDGGSFAVRPDGQFILSAPAFSPGVYYFDPAAAPIEPPTSLGAVGVHRAIVTAIHDYVKKNTLDGVWVAVSGGLDSAVVAALAWEALGADRVSLVFMPGPFTTAESRELATALSKALGIHLIELPIDGSLESLSQSLAGHTPVEGLVAENLQARVRGVLLMGLSNATGRVALCPATKPEIALGYNTLYGDTVGALAPIGDLLKEEVYELARLMNSRHHRELIPAGTLERPPSAELRPDQRDDQDLPRYEVLDPLLSALLVRNEKPEALATRFGQSMVDDILRTLNRSEHKRRQLPIVIKLSPKAFGTGRRMPTTYRYTG
ncbi:MAG: NAD+ synthase [Candidatus Bipolaricaulota bacterium]